MIKYAKMSLFDAPPGSILMHACNAQGVWGRGIAAEFKHRFPNSYREYVGHCAKALHGYPFYGVVGRAFILGPESGKRVACLVTSYDYRDLDSEETIILQTITALEDFCLAWEEVSGGEPIYCNKFNSDLFAVPWEKTEKVLNYFARKYNLTIIVCEI